MDVIVQVLEILQVSYQEFAENLQPRGPTSCARNVLKCITKDVYRYWC